MKETDEEKALFLQLEGRKGMEPMDKGREEGLRRIIFCR